MNISGCNAELFLEKMVGEKLMYCYAELLQRHTLPTFLLQHLQG